MGKVESATVTEMVINGITYIPKGTVEAKALEKDGLVKREVFPEVPLRVEYSLTAFGLTLVPVLDAIAKWGRNLGEKNGKLEEVVHIKPVK